jgi:hypothetical protein
MAYICGTGKTATYSSDMEFLDCVDDSKLFPAGVAGVSGDTTQLYQDQGLIAAPLASDQDNVIEDTAALAPVAVQAEASIGGYKTAVAIPDGTYKVRTAKCPCTKKVTTYTKTPYTEYVKKPKQITVMTNVTRQVPEKYTDYRQVQKFRTVEKKVPVTVYKTVKEQKPYMTSEPYVTTRMVPKIEQVQTQKTIMESVPETRYRSTPVTRTVQTVRDCIYREPNYTYKCNTCEE